MVYEQHPKNRDDQTQILTLGHTLSRIRKCTKVSQVELSKILGIDQSALSRIEHGKQMLSVSQLFQASQYFGIPAQDLMLGQLNYWDLAKKFGQPIPYQKRYQKFHFSRVREIKPIISFLNMCYGIDTTHSLLSRFEFDSVLFHHYDQPISVLFTLDLIRCLINQKLLTEDNFKYLIEQTRTKEIHGPYLQETYDAQNTPLALLHARVINSHYYENNFAYTLNELSKKSISISVKPNDHMNEIPFRDDILGNFLCDYRKECFRQFPLYNKFAPLLLDDHACDANNECVYTFKVA